MNFEALMSKFSSTLGENFPGIIVTLIILFLGIFIAKFIKNVFISAFSKTNFNKKIMAGDSGVNIAKLLGQLIYYVILLNVILIVLERMNIKSVLDPLKDLAGQFLGYVPNIIAAGIIFYAGWILAKIAQSFVEIATVKLDTWIQSKNLGINFKFSKFLSTFVFAVVFLPLAIQAFATLDFESISIPAQQMLGTFFTVIFRLFGAAVIIGVTYYVARFVTNLLGTLLESLSVNELPGKLGIQSFIPGNLSVVSLVKKVVMFFVMLTAFTTAVDLIGVELLSDIFAQVLAFGGKLLIGGVIIFIGAALANLAYKKISTNPENKFVASIARFAILGLVLSMGLKAMGLADNIVNMAFGLTLGALAIATAISFGVGGIDAAKSLTTSWVSKLKK